VTAATNFLETNGARIHYEVEGSGEPVVLIHAGVANLRMWDDQVTALRGDYRVIRYDTRGFGRTETDAVEFSNRADIAALLDHLGEASAHVVGMSRAGSIALDFALEYRDRVRSLVVAAGGISGYESPDEADASVFGAAERLWEASDWDALAEWETAYWADGPGQPKDRVVELRAPLLVILGTLDDPGTQESCRHLAEVVRGARLEVFEGAAHMLNLEQPERFNALLREFLSGAPAKG